MSFTEIYAFDKAGNASLKEMNDFPKRLRSLREAKRPLRSMMVTSQLMGLPKDALRRYERGESEPKMDTLRKIADYYHVSVDYLMGRMNY